MTLKDRAEKMIDTLAFNRKWDRKTRIRYYVAEMEEAIRYAIQEAVLTKMIPDKRRVLR